MPRPHLLVKDLREPVRNALLKEGRALHDRADISLLCGELAPTSGGEIRTLAPLAGVSVRTVYNWIRLNKKKIQARAKLLGSVDITTVVTIREGVVLTRSETSHREW